MALTDDQKALIQAFVRAVNAGLDALTPVDAPDDDEGASMRAAVAIIAAVASDQKFRDAWADPEFQDAACCALRAEFRQKIARAELSAKGLRLRETVTARLPDGKKVEELFFTGSELRARRRVRPDGRRH